MRQLNFYGFHKVESKAGYAFHHEFFRKNSPELLKRIQRKKSVPRKTLTSTSEQSMAVPLGSASSSGCESVMPSSPSSTSSVKSGTDIDSPALLIDGSGRSSCQSSSSLYLCLLDEISKLRQQSSETQATIVELKKVLMASHARENCLFFSFIIRKQSL